MKLNVNKIYEKVSYTIPKPPAFSSDIQLSLYITKEFNMGYVPDYVPYNIRNIVNNYKNSEETIWFHILRHYAEKDDTLVILYYLLTNKDNNEIIYLERGGNVYQSHEEKLEKFKQTLGVKDVPDN